MISVQYYECYCTLLRGGGRFFRDTVNYAKSSLFTHSLSAFHTNGQTEKRTNHEYFISYFTDYSSLQFITLPTSTVFILFDFLTVRICHSLVNNVILTMECSPLIKSCDNRPCHSWWSWVTSKSHFDRLHVAYMSLYGPQVVDWYCLPYDMNARRLLPRLSPKQ